MAGQAQDKHLVERIRTGDSTAFEQLFRKYQHKVLNFFHKLCFNRALAEDLVQETFLRLWRSRRGLRPEAGKFTTYLFQVAKNCYINHAKRGKFQRQQSGRELDSITESRPGVDPGLAAENSELQQRLRDAIGTLPEEQRIAFVLSRYEGLKYEEISTVLSVSPRTVERRVAEAARLLAKRLLGK